MFLLIVLSIISFSVLFSRIVFSFFLLYNTKSTALKKEEYQQNEGILVKMTKSAFVSIIGRPSTGKSTLLNTLCGEKVSIVSPVPQTTRNKIRGILTSKEGQLVFLDTPGFHQSERKFNQYMTAVITEAIEESDLVLYLIDANRPPGEEEEKIIATLTPHLDRLIVGINKIDLPESKPEEMKVFLEKKFLESSASAAPPIRTISALSGEGTEGLLADLYRLAPEGELMYPEEYYTDQEPEFRIAEIIREYAMAKVRQEVPHSLYVEIADMEMKGKTQEELWVRAFLVLERESQKGFLIGRGGETIKSIRKSSAKEINRLFPYSVHLDLRVKVNKKWRKKDPLLKRLTR
jgi:GTPase